MPRPARLLCYGFFIFVIVSLSSFFFGDSGPAAPRFQSHGALQNKLNFKSAPRGPHDVNNSTLGFAKVFALTNPDRPDHLDHFISSAAAVGIEAEILQGIRGGDVSSDTLPTLRGLPRAVQSRNEVVGTWRSHLNFVREVVNRRLSSALLVEDETDWDVHLKSQLELFASGSRYINRAPENPKPWSPYGDDWDLLWLGHCGAGILANDLRRMIVENDATVPIPQRRINDYSATVDTLKEGLEDHTRLIFQTGGARCAQAYALSYRGARRVLHTLSSMSDFRPVDIVLSSLCEGGTKFKCLSIFPQIFERYTSADTSATPGSDDDDDQPVQPRTDVSNIVFSTRQNMIQSFDEVHEYVRRFPDDPSPSGNLQTRTLGRD